MSCKSENRLNITVEVNNQPVSIIFSFCLLFLPEVINVSSSVRSRSQVNIGHTTFFCIAKDLSQKFETLPRKIMWHNESAKQYSICRGATAAPICYNSLFLCKAEPKLWNLLKLHHATPKCPTSLKMPPWPPAVRASSNPIQFINEYTNSNPTAKEKKKRSVLKFPGLVLWRAEHF